MICEMKPYVNLPCRLQEFTINRKTAEQKDFGYHYDTAGNKSIEDIMNEGCDNCKFDTIPYKNNIKVAKKYKLSESEYEEICADLREILSIGCCCRCMVTFER